MANKYDDADGVWRTIGGRRVFIRTGQSLSDAMKESGKFKKKNAKDLDDELRAKEDKYLSSDKGRSEQEKERKEIKDLHDKLKEKAKEEGYDVEKTNWRDDIKTKEEYIGDIPKSSYDIADEIEEKFGDKEVITRDEFEEFLTGKYDDEDADVRGILAQNGWETKFESDDEGNEGDLVRLKEDNSFEAKELDSKSVMDSDGFTTDYTLYEMPNGKYKAVFGDKDVYGPDADADMEFDNLKEAQEWFDDYNGFEEDKYAKDIMYQDDLTGNYENAYKTLNDMNQQQAKEFVEQLNDSGRISKEDYDTLKDFVGFEDEKPKVNFQDFDGERDLKIGDTYIDGSGDLRKVVDRPYGNQLEKKLTKAFMPGQQDLKGTKWETEKLRAATDEDYATYPSIRNANRDGTYTQKVELKKDMSALTKAKGTSEFDNKVSELAKKYDREDWWIKASLEDYERKNPINELSSNSGQEKISDNVKVMRYGDDYVVLKNGHNEKEFKNQSDAESYAKTLTSSEATKNQMNRLNEYEDVYDAYDKAMEKANGPKSMNDKIREKASKKSTFKDDLPKHTEIKTQGTSNRKEVSENIQAHILDYYDSPQDFLDQMDAMDYLPTKWKQGEELAKGGSYLIYNGDMSDFLNELKINPKGKTFSEDKAFDMYTSLVGRESAKLYDRLMKNEFNKYKQSHPLTKMTLEEFIENRKK